MGDAAVAKRADRICRQICGRNSDELTLSRQASSGGLHLLQIEDISESWEISQTSCLAATLFTCLFGGTNGRVYT